MNEAARRITLLLLCTAILLTQFGPRTAAAADPGPALTIPEARLASALTCYGRVTAGGPRPVLLLPAAARTPKANWEGGYSDALPRIGRVACAVPLVLDGAGDIQDSAEYVVYAVRELARRSGRRISIVGHSQGGFAAVWALRFWPDLAPLVDDVVTFGSAFQGVQISRTTCDVRKVCEPGTWQVATGSNFVAALNHGDPTPAATTYTTVYSDNDEFARLPQPATRLDGAHEFGVQQLCPGRPVEHLQLSDDAATFAIVRDALEHTGTASMARISPLVCASVTPAGFDPARRAAALTGGGPRSAAPTTDREPALRCYVDASCAWGDA